MKIWLRFEHLPHQTQRKSKFHFNSQFPLLTQLPNLPNVTQFMLNYAILVQNFCIIDDRWMM